MFQSAEAGPTPIPPIPPSLYIHPTFCPTLPHLELGGLAGLLVEADEVDPDPGVGVGGGGRGGQVDHEVGLGERALLAHHALREPEVDEVPVLVLLHHHRRG